MSASNIAFDATNFSGRVRLFPLPNLVVFPHVMQALHIFEPRYRAMFEEAVADDRLIAMALLALGWEPNYEGRPAVEPMACLGRVATWQEVTGGKYNLLLLGLRRLKIVREMPPDKPFREAEVVVCEDEYASSGTSARADVQRGLVKTFQKLLPQTKDAQQEFEELASSNMSLGMLTDIMAYTLDLGLPLKYRLLAERNVDRRAELLGEHLRSAEADSGAARASGFPPQFSPN